MPYDRDLLLYGAKRHAVLGLDEIRQYGIDSYRNPDYVSIYGLDPAAAYALGVRMLGRTAVECTRDDLAAAISVDVARWAKQCASASQLVIDPFAGSGNTLYWLLRELPSARAVAFENDPLVQDISSKNLALLHLQLRLECIDFSAGLEHVTAAPNELVSRAPVGTRLGRAVGLGLEKDRATSRGHCGASRAPL